MRRTEIECSNEGNVNTIMEMKMSRARVNKTESGQNRRWTWSARIALVTAALTVSSISWATPAATDSLAFGAGSKVWVEGGSTIRSWKCEAAELQGSVITKPNADVKTTADLSSVTQVGLTIEVEKLDCSNGTMNGHMQKALKLKEHPTISFSVVTYNLAPSGDTAVAVSMKGKLTIAGTEKDVVVEGLAAAGSDGLIHVTGKHSFPMTEFGVKPPSLMLGTMKVKDQVEVGFDVILK